MHRSGDIVNLSGIASEGTLACDSCLLADDQSCTPGRCNFPDCLRHSEFDAIAPSVVVSASSHFSLRDLFSSDKDCCLFLDSEACHFDAVTGGFDREASSHCFYSSALQDSSDVGSFRDLVLSCSEVSGAFCRTDAVTDTDASSVTKKPHAPLH